jgi:hypothetical protein
VVVVVVLAAAAAILVMILSYNYDDQSEIKRNSSDSLHCRNSN